MAFDPTGTSASEAILKQIRPPRTPKGRQQDQPLPRINDGTRVVLSREMMDNLSDNDLCSLIRSSYQIGVCVVLIVDTDLEIDEAMNKLATEGVPPLSILDP